MGRRGVKRAAALAVSAVLGLAGVLGTAAVPVETGCTTRQCAGGVEQWEETSGGWADPDTKTIWLTHLSVDDPWISYGGEVTVDIHFPDTGRRPINVAVYTGVTEDGGGSPNVPPPPDSGDMFSPNFAMAAGELAVMQTWTTNMVGVKNATCADYVMYAMIQFDSRFPCPGSASTDDPACTMDGAPIEPAPSPLASDASAPASD